MQYIASTAEVLALKVLNRSVDRTWVKWAMDMIEAGFESESLLMLAAQTEEPFNQFEFSRLTDNMFRELGLVCDEHDLVIINYVCYLINQSLNGITAPFVVLGILKNVYIELDHVKYLQDFYMLYFAKADLLVSDIQWYWMEANKENIDTVINDYFLKWNNEHCMNWQQITPPPSHTAY